MTEPARGGPLDAASRSWWRWLVLVLVLIGLGVGSYVGLRPKAEPPILVETGHVQSAVTHEGDSLQVVVQWELTDPGAAGRAESLRVEVQANVASATTTQVRVHPGLRREDTVYVPAPLPGETADGLSCVAVQQRSMMSRERCTPWRYVRPAAAAGGPGRAGANQPVRIVVRPNGLQVDPDVGGQCAAWQRGHPTDPVWIDVNHLAVPACTGPNRRPTVAQFCAFAVLADGRRIKTTNSADIPYCDRLFRDWERERAS